MPVGQLDKTISALAKYLNLPEQDRLLEASITLNNEGDKPDERISKLILKGVDGSLTTREIINDINNYLEKTDDASTAGAEINRFIKIFSTMDDTISAQEPSPTKIQDIAGPINSKNKETKENPTLSAICMKHARITPANKEVNALTSFFNIIPTLEFSKCVPFLKVEVITPRASLGIDGKLNTMSILKFLLGAEEIKEGTATHTLAQGLSLNDESSISGMEMFTAPQTFINSDLSNDQNLRVVPVIDKFRPFLSLEKLNLKVIPQEGALSFKSGELYIVLHDRSRLHEISELVKPDLFGKTELLIEYGWSHPDKSGDNVFADLLNTMRVKEKYGIHNTTYEFDDIGQAKIKLMIHMKGATDFFNSNISEGDEDIISSQKAIRELTEEIAELKQKLFKGKDNIQFSKRIRPLTILDTPTDLATAPDLKTIRKELRRIKANLKRGGGSKDAKELFEKLKELYGPDRGRSSQRGEFGNLKRSVAEAIRKKLNIIANIRRIKKTIFVSTGTGPVIQPIFQAPLAQPVVKKQAKTINVLKYEKTSFKDPFLDLDQEDNSHLLGKKVSLGKLFLIFVGYPLVSSSKFDDVQFIFYNFNMNAGNMRNKNIAEFKIDTKDFNQEFTKMSLKRQTGDIPLWEFKESILNKFVDDYGNEEYGIADEFAWQTDSKTGKRKAIKTQEKGKSIAFEREDVVDGLKLRDGIFKLPIVEVHVETTPGTSLLEGENPDSKNNKSILKLHIFDRQNSPYETQQSLLQAVRTDSMETIAKDISNLKGDPNFHKQEFIRYLQKAEALNLIEPFNEQDVEDGEEKVIQIRGGPKELKKFLYETTPYITFANQNNAILNLGYKTLYESDLTTINLNRSPREGNLVPTGTELNNLPLLMMPGEMNVTTIGCPIVQFMQQFFVDVQTGTDIDNIYSIGELSHTIEAGKFETSFRLFAPDSYGKYRSLIHNVGVALKQVASKQEID